MKVIVLGAGLVGSPMAVDLMIDKEFDVTVVDRNDALLDKLNDRYTINTVCKDLSNPENIGDLVRDYDFVLNALPGFLGFQTLKAIIKARKNVVDISFFPEDPFELDSLAKKMNITAIMDCGVAPGMSNILIGYADHLMEKSETAAIYVGGLPKVREWPYEYKAVFSPIDVIEEYTRPARLVENGKIIIRPALSDTELLNFPEIGTLEAFNSDGLRTLTRTLDIPHMKEKTMRYPGHVEKMLILRETGFFDQREIPVGDSKIRPIDVTSKLLFPKWELKEGEVDITVMKIIIEGIKSGKKLRYTYNLYDEYDERSKTHSMARTTGYTATMALRMIRDGLYTKIGLSVPEFIGQQPNCVEYLLNGLKDRGVIYQQTIDEL